MTRWHDGHVPAMIEHWACSVTSIFASQSGARRRAIRGNRTILVVEKGTKRKE